jgi:hypothetical protein
LAVLGDDDGAAGFDLANALAERRLQLPDADSLLAHAHEATLYQVWPRGVRREASYNAKLELRVGQVVFDEPPPDLEP